MRERTAGYLAVTTSAKILAVRISRTVMADRVAKKTNAALTAIIVKIRQSMPDSEALNPVSGKSHSKEILQARPVWTEYSTAHARYMAPPKNQPITPTGIVGCSSRQAS